MTGHWQESIKNAPRETGVYLMKDADDKVIYVGKARDLRSRTRAYLNGTDKRCMIPFLTSRIRAVEFIVTKTEKEALILENNLIKEHRPRYNVYFRDDKAYFSIRIDLHRHKFPRFQLVRQIKKDGASYFGPYPSGSAAKETLHFLQPIFPLRTCSDREFTNHRRPCLEYQIKRCLAPCAGLVDISAYERMVREGIAFLEGREKGLLADLASRMKAASQQLNFEEAALLRDRIAAIETTLEKQRIVSTNFGDQDIFGLYRDGDQSQALVLKIRSGRLVGTKTFPLIALAAKSEEILSSLMTQYYDGEVEIPPRIITPIPVRDGAVIAEWLTEKTGKKVILSTPKKGRARELLLMADSNAENMFKTERQGRQNIETALGQLMVKLGLKSRPDRIECFDISNVSGKYAVGSLVTFVDGRPRKDGYRLFRIRTVADMDDYGMMREVLLRRYGKKEGLPDLVVVDGGKGQLGVALTLFGDLGIETLDVIALAKEKPASPSSSVSKAEERVYLPRRKEPVYLYRWPSALFLLQQIRDEAHRFAISYHHKLKQKKDFHSLLDDIPGIGETRKKVLLSHFGDIKKIKAASIGELQKAAGIGKELSVFIKEFLERDDRST